MINQAWHNRIVTELMYSAVGDLILGKRGELHYRCTCADTPDGFKDLPWELHRPAMLLARISREGWTLTADGAQFILENCPPENAADERLLMKVALIYSDAA